MSIYPAHIRSDGIAQPTEEHCRNVAEKAEACLSYLNLGTTGYLAGLLHDCGKFTEEFRQYITRASKGEHVVKGSVIHTFAPVAFWMNGYHDHADPFNVLTAEILSFVDGSHHGQFDLFDRDKKSGIEYRLKKQPEYDKRAISCFLNNCADGQTINRSFEKSVSEISSAGSVIESISNDMGEYFFHLSLLSRLILSALIDADRSDTAIFEHPDSVQTERPVMNDIWLKASETLERYLSGFEKTSKIQQARSKLSELCLNASDKPSGIYRLNLPTGGGKTLSGLRFALNHAAKCNKDRIFLISPLLSIIDQNAEEIRKAINNDAIILEHHSDIINDEKTAEEAERYAHLTETWDSPIIITTLVQFLNTLFSGNTSSIRRFNRLSNSVIVIDEVQTVPTKMLTLFNLAMNFLSGLCNATIILCSATQPEFDSLEHALLVDKCDLVKKEDLSVFLPVFKRNTISFKGNYRIEETPGLISQILEKYDSILVICNKKDQASAVYSMTAGMNAQRYHLSAGMCISHRKDTLEKIKNDLDSNRRVVCISTQVIEAGVDISFDAVIRFNAGIDNIVQAAGRCNRNGSNGDGAPVWIINCIDEKLQKLPEIKHAKDASVALIEAFRNNSGKFDNDLSSEKAVSYYYRKLYGEMKEGYFDYKGKDIPSVYSLLSDNDKYTPNGFGGKYIIHQAFKTAGESFKVFENEQYTLIVPWKEGKQIIYDLISKGDHITAKDLERAKPYTVSVFSYQFEQLENDKAIIQLAGGTVYALAEGFYNDETGIINSKESEDLCNILIS